jgi:hypothetical protein
MQLDGAYLLKERDCRTIPHNLAELTEQLAGEGLL